MFLRFRQPWFLAALGRSKSAAAILCTLSGVATGIAGNTALILDFPPQAPSRPAVSLYYTTAWGSFTATKNYANGVTINTTAEDGWEFSFATANGSPLTPGTYTNTRPLGQLNGTHPGFEYVEGGTSEQVNDASFVVKEVTYGTGFQIISFHATFSYGPPTSIPFQGEMMYNASGPYPPRVQIVGSLDGFATEGQPFRHWIWSRSQRPTIYPNTYQANTLPTGLSVDRTTGLISGKPTHRGSYVINVQASSALGSASANFHLTVDPPWRSTGAFTGLLLRNDKWEPLGDGKTGFLYSIRRSILDLQVGRDTGALYQLCKQ